VVEPNPLDLLGKNVSGKRDDVAVKFDRVLAEKLKLIVQRRGGTMSGYLTTLCRTHIEREYAQVVREMSDEINKSEK
jgi:hypothetical protein